jgi:hypothetical protein
MSPYSSLYFPRCNNMNLWISVWGFCKQRVICMFLDNADQYIHFGRMWRCTPLIAQCVRWKILTLCWHSHESHWYCLCTLNNSMQPIIFTLLTSYIAFLCIIFCIQEFCYGSIPDQLLSTLSGWEMPSPNHSPAHLAGNLCHLDHFSIFG